MESERNQDCLPQFSGGTNSPTTQAAPINELSSAFWNAHARSIGERISDRDEKRSMASCFVLPAGGVRRVFRSKVVVVYFTPVLLYD
jgi:hypothetical protein